MAHFYLSLFIFAGLYLKGSQWVLTDYRMQMDQSYVVTWKLPRFRDFMNIRQKWCHLRLAEMTSQNDKKKPGLRSANFTSGKKLVDLVAAQDKTNKLKSWPGFLSIKRISKDYWRNHNIFITTSLVGDCFVVEYWDRLTLISHGMTCKITTWLIAALGFFVILWRYFL